MTQRRLFTGEILSHHYPYYFSPIKLNYNPLRRNWRRLMVGRVLLELSNVALSVEVKRKAYTSNSSIIPAISLRNNQITSTTLRRFHSSPSPTQLDAQDSSTSENLIMLQKKHSKPLSISHFGKPLKALSAHQLHYWNSIFFFLSSVLSTVVDDAFRNPRSALFTQKKSFKFFLRFFYDWH